ncbi:MAG TPA: hypothetical protein VKA02_13540 [Candidatus Acidoferrum sp.]|nr:hypothetical protein [Candidatus Acidoferrum sp.]
MNADFSFKTAVCTEYEELLTACHNALEGWRKRRDEIARLHLQGKKAGDELLRLQADYAEAHVQLESHEENCQTCRFVCKIAGRDFTAITDAVLDKKRYA